MTLQEALNILNLKYNCTEKDLKKAYKTLVSKYHPDLYENKSQHEKIKAEEKTKKINEAKEIVTKYLKEKLKSTKETHENICYEKTEKLTNLKSKYMKEVLLELDYISKIDSKDKIFNKRKEDFLKIIKTFYNSIGTQPNVLSIQISYNAYREEYFKLLCYYTYEHWNTSKIMDLVNGNIKINNKSSLEYTRTEMTKIINEILEKELENYKEKEIKNILHQTSYLKMESTILGTKLGYVDICLWGYINLENMKKDFNLKIREIMNKCNKRQELLYDLLSYNKNEININIINSLKQAIEDEEKFYKIYNQINIKTIIKTKIKKIFQFKN